jgi:flagella basal body P-ring formation protein FlgA
MHLVHLRFFLVFGLGSLWSSTPLPAVSPQILGSPGGEGTTEDTRLVTLSALLAARYSASGDLRVSWHRPAPESLERGSELEIIQAPSMLAPQLLLTVRGHDQAGRAADFVVLVRVELWREGWTLRQPAAVGEPVLLSALESRAFDALRERDGFVLDPSGDPASAEFDFARSVSPGRLLVWRDVARRPLVRRGRPVDVVASDGSLTVSLRAVALHDAARGETVRVRNPDSRREFAAVVIAENRASVRF